MSEANQNERMVKLTPAQTKVLQYVDNDGELQIGGSDGRPVRRDVAERLVSSGILIRTHSPLPYENWWGYRRV